MDGSNRYTGGSDGSSSSSSTTITSYKWQQVPDANGVTSKAVTLNSVDRPVVNFVAPILNASNAVEQDYMVLYFKLTVTDSNGQTDSAVAPIVVVRNSSSTVASCIDTDNDGICNTVDTMSNSFSNSFSDISSSGGHTAGTIVDRGNQTLLIDKDVSTAGGGGQRWWRWN